MRNSTRTELRTLREVGHFLLPLLCCEFCEEPLLDPKEADKVFGDKAHSPLKDLKLTTHHRNGKHRDNRRGNCLHSPELKAPATMGVPSKQFAICGNTSLVHRKCHGEHEMKLNHHKRKVMKVKPLRDRAKQLIDQLCKSKYFFAGAEEKFLNSMQRKYLLDKKKFTRYEIRRLKKLAAKVEV